MCACTTNNIGEIMKKTQQIIADLAGVSRGTVDRVLHGRPNVKPETREKVLKAIEILKYSPNAVGRALALSNRSYSICVAIPENPFFSDVLTGIRAAVSKLSDYNLSIEYIITNGMSSMEIVRALDDNKCMALMAAVNDSSEIRDCIRRKMASGIPVVTFNTDIRNCGRICFVGQNLYKSGRIAASLMCKLLQNERNKILIVTGSNRFQAHRARVQGFTDVIEQSGKNIEIVRVIETNDDSTLTYERMHRALGEEQDINGIYISAGHADVCINVLEEIGKKYHIVANDLTPAIKTALKKNIFDFTIFQNPFEQGYRPVMLLFDLLLYRKYPVKEFYYTDNTVITSEMLD